MLRVGLLGAGRIGQVHAGNIAAHTESELAAVSDINRSASDKLARAYGAASRGTDEILADSSIDAVLVATSTDTHSDLIEAATAAGKAVLCEKPVDLDLQRARSCLKTAEKTRQPVMIGFNRRFDPNFSLLKKSFDSGEIGSGELLSLTSYDPAPPPVSYIKVSGGLFRDMAIHDFDMACWIFADVPEYVSATGTCIVDSAIGEAGDVDTAVTTLHFSAGRLAVIKNSRRAVYGYDQRIELLGSGGLLSAGNVVENTLSRSSVDGVVAAKPEFFFLERYARAYAAEWSAFVRIVLDGSPPPVTLRDGVNALAVAEAATIAAKTNRTVATREMLGPSA
jgi:myo-inositol 2-dehydrogenase/D-chiro-inositol 1-dehydrogenase